MTANLVRLGTGNASSLSIMTGDVPHQDQGWDRDVAKRTLDELFSVARRYRSSKEYRELLHFTAGFHFYSPFNAMLLHIQMPGATFVAPPHRWLEVYGRRIKPEARPLVILQPMGPVMFVFDVSDTEPGEDKAAPLPFEVVHPFEVRKGRVGAELSYTRENARRDGVRLYERRDGSQSAGRIACVDKGQHLIFPTVPTAKVPQVQVPLRFELGVNSDLSAEAKYATIVHELAHLYCGHLGTPDRRWWPDRRWLSADECEFEAESVCYLVCERLGIDNPSDKYLARYQEYSAETPSISLDCVMKAAGMIEQMGRERMKPRKDKE